MKLFIQSQQGDVVRFVLEGRVSQREVSANEEPIGDRLGEDAYTNRLMIDMSEVASLDSSGVNWLLVCQKRVREAGGSFVLHSLSPIAKNVVKVLNLQTVFKLAADDSEALRLLMGGD
ncbi:MAG: STAS domain-containing protein [Pirellulaceae bacterium]